MKPFVSLRATELDASIMEQDRMILRACVQGVDERFIWRAVQARNDLTRDWGIAVGTRPVEVA